MTKPPPPNTPLSNTPPSMLPARAGSPEAEMPIQRTASLSTAVQLSYVDVGDPQSNLVLVLLPGMSDSWRSWEPIFPFLPRAIRVIAVSQRGHGDSDKPAKGYSVSDYADDLAALIDALDLTRVVVAGHSSASLVARRFALDHRSRVAGLVLEGSFVRLAGPVVDGAGQRFAALVDPIEPVFVRDFAAGTFVRPVEKAFIESMVAENLKVPARVWRDTFRGLLDYNDSDELATLDAPTLIVWGDRDTIIDRALVDELVGSLHSPTLISYQGVGHTPHWEVPEQFARDIGAFVASCWERRSVE